MVQNLSRDLTTIFCAQKLQSERSHNHFDKYRLRHIIRTLILCNYNIFNRKKRLSDFYNLM